MMNQQEQSQHSFDSSSISFLNCSNNNNQIESLKNIPNQNTQKSMRTITPSDTNNLILKGESIIDLGYFQYFKQTYRPKSHPNNNFFKVVSSKKTKNFVELSISNTQKNFGINNNQICKSLQSVCPTKVEKARKLYSALMQKDYDNTNCSNMCLSSDNAAYNEKIQNNAFEYATAILNQRSNSLFKYNIFSKSEDNQVSYLKYGMSTNALNAIRMSADYFSYVHMRFGIAPFLDKHYTKNFFEINQNLLEQITINNNNNFQSKYVMNLSSVGAIYTQTECEILDLNNGFYLEIQYYQDESILTNQVSEINKTLRMQAKEQVYSQNSSNFINKYYPNAQTWSSSKRQEVDADLVDKIMKKRDLNDHSEFQMRKYSQSVMSSSKSAYSLAQSISLM